MVNLMRLRAELLCAAKRSQDKISPLPLSCIVAVGAQDERLLRQSLLAAADPAGWALAERPCQMLVPFGLVAL